MPDVQTIQSRQRRVFYALIALPFVVLLLYLIPVAIGGRVVDAQSSQPLADVVVQLGNGRQVRSGPDGRLTARALRGRLSATAEVAGYQPWQGRVRFLWLPLWPARLAISLEPTRLQGQILDDSTGQPLVGAIVSANRQVAASAADGSFQLLRLPASPLSLQAEAEGFITLRRQIDAAHPRDGSQSLDLRLLPNGLHGAIVDARTGQPLAGAALRFQDKTGQSQADGSYYLPGVADTGQLSVALPGYLPLAQAVDSEAVLRGEEALDVALSPTVLAGQIDDGRTGQPLAGVQVSAGGRTAATDEAGRYRLERLHGQNLLLTAQRPGYDPVQQPVDEGSHLLSSQPLNATLLPRHLAGRVFNQVADSPLPGATASAAVGSAVSDEEGRFLLWGAEPPLVVSVSADGFFDAQVQYTDNAEQRVALVPRHAVVVAEDLVSGERLAAITLVGPRSQSTTDGQGVALLRLLEPGDVFTATAAGYAPVAVAYDGADQVQVQLYRDTVAGQAVDAQSGQGVPGATLYVYDGQNCQGPVCRGAQPLQVVDADPDGRFLVRGLPPRPQLMVKAPGYELFYAAALAPGDCAAPLCLRAGMASFEARGFYIPFHYLYNRGLIRERLDLVAQSPVLNAVVVDMKSDFGEIAWDSQHPVAREIGVHQPDVMSAAEFLAEARQRGIYAIARFVTFKDDALAEGRPQWALSKISEPGRLWRDGENLAWVDPYRQEVREYQIELAKELAALGFDELQFDYFRFTGQRDHTQFTYSVTSTVDNRRQAITTFSRELMAALKPYGVFTAIDVFGSIILNGQEPLIGQNLADMAIDLDYLSPMIYPQVWWPGTFPGCDEPVLCPYQVIYDSVIRVRETVAMPTRIRPWLQGYPNNFRASGPAAGYNYGPAEMLIQRQAAEDANAAGWLFWSGGGNFPDDIFGPMPSLAELQAAIARRQAGGS